MLSMPHIRPYRPDDWERLCEIHDAARMDELRSSGLEAAFLSLEKTAESEGLFSGTVLVADLDNRIQGFVAFTHDELTWLYVDPVCYRRGVGRALLREVIKASAGPLTAEVLMGNESARLLYLSEGFQVERRVDGKLTGNEAFRASGYILRRT